jgi:hypothetical protein
MITEIASKPLSPPSWFTAFVTPVMKIGTKNRAAIIGIAMLPKKGIRIEPGCLVAMTK